mmetsp:Transcript_112725/g.360107  ORF Transcript_112725/g.360107 Transcript_112725/m.360107 type:complete len:210 (+) Transcript_112725:159-788(+)
MAGRPAPAVFCNGWRPLQPYACRAPARLPGARCPAQRCARTQPRCSAAGPSAHPGRSGPSSRRRWRAARRRTRTRASRCWPRRRALRGSCPRTIARTRTEPSGRELQAEGTGLPCTWPPPATSRPRPGCCSRWARQTSTSATPSTAWRPSTLRSAPEAPLPPACCSTSARCPRSRRTRCWLRSAVRRSTASRRLRGVWRRSGSPTWTPP